MLSRPGLRLFLRPFELLSLLERQRFRVCVQEVGFSLICDARGWMGPLAIMYRDTWLVDHCSEDRTPLHTTPGRRHTRSSAGLQVRYRSVVLGRWKHWLGVIQVMLVRS